MSTANIRHRTAAKHSSDDAPVRVIIDSNPKGGQSTWQNKKFHAGVWGRIIAIISLFSILVFLISRVEKYQDTGQNSSVRAGGTKRINGEGNPSFVTVVMPSVVNPVFRPLRLTNIAKTWGPSSRAIYVVHDINEYPEGHDIDKALESIYPQNLILPNQIHFDEGVARLEHVIRTVHTDINPDFGFFVNDHTFVLPGNLCQFLKEYDSSKDLYAGHALKGEHEAAFNSGAAGYVLSRSTMEKLINEWDNPESKCSASSASKFIQGNPGILTAQCFGQVLNISLVDTRDDRDLSHKFHAYGLVRTVTGKVDDWYVKKHKTLDDVLGMDAKYHHQLQDGRKCCSTGTVSFHYVEASESLALWEVLQVVHTSPSLSGTEIKDLINKVWPRDHKSLGAYAHALPGPQSAVWYDLVEVVRKVSVGMVPPSSSC